MTKKNKRGIITVERPNNDLSECTIKSNDISVNSLHIALFLLSLFVAGPVVTCFILILIGFFSSYTKTILGAILATGAYGFLGVFGFLLFKLSCMFTLFSLFSNEGTMKKIKELKGNNEFSSINDGISDIEQFGTGAGETFVTFRDDVMDFLKKTKLMIKSEYPTLNNVLDKSYDVSLVSYDKIKYGFNVAKDDAYVMHTVLYNSKYDIYVKISDYVYLVYMLIKFSSALFTASNIFSQIPGMDMSEMDSMMNGSMKMPETEAEAQLMLNDISNTLSSLSSLSSMMGSMQGMGQMKNPNKYKMGNTLQGQEDIFAKLLSM